MDVQAKINDLWNRASAEYDGEPTHGIHDARQEEAWRTALRAMLPPPPADVLDAGTGTGAIALLAASLGHRVRGVDLSEGMLARARQKAAESRLSVRFETGDAMDPGGEAGSLDALVSRHVLWTLTDPKRALRNWLRLLRPGGKLAVIDGLWGRLPDPSVDEVRAALPLLAPEVSVGDIVRLVEGAGFVDVAAGDLAKIDRIERSTEAHYVVTASKAR